MTTTHHQALADLAEAQQKLTKALLDEPRTAQAIAEAAENVRREHFRGICGSLDGLPSSNTTAD